VGVLAVVAVRQQAQQNLVVLAIRPLSAHHKAMTVATASMGHRTILAVAVVELVPQAVMQHQAMLVWVVRVQVQASAARQLLMPVVAVVVAISLVVRLVVLVAVVLVAPRQSGQMAQSIWVAAAAARVGERKPKTQMVETAVQAWLS
jgi:hypothetical protein